ncbi:MAG TPA: lysylphosphatidylglycerol synthase transmembrane domain-containing protein [Acidimicrobiales bacterium]|nr:lysylphosphatidylglycerol synthase transmembrane domain-containing protein [Acidimicrobiales bacterium]
MAATSTDRRRVAWLVARVVASIAMLALLVTQVDDVDLSDAIPEWGPSTAAWLAGALLLTFGGIALSAVRWKQVLHALGVESRWSRLMSHYLAGQFVSNVLPTTIGGDILRVARLSRENGESPTTFASVVIERLSGWLVLPLITLIGLAANPGLRELGRATRFAVLVAVLTLIALTLVLVAVNDRRVGGRFATSEGWRRFAGAVHLGVARLREHPAAAIGVLAVGFAYQMVLVLAAAMAARALGLPDVGLTALLTFLPAVLIVQVLPIGISGLGLREGAFVLFLGPLGVPSAQAIALGLLLYLLNLVTSLAGAPAFALGGGRRAVPSEIDAVV